MIFGEEDADYRVGKRLNKPKHEKPSSKRNQAHLLQEVRQDNKVALLTQ